MRSATLLLMLILALAVSQPPLPLASGDPVTIDVTLYAHTDPSATSVGGRVLSLSGNATSRSVADVRDGLAFTLVPSLSAPLQLLGGITVYVWLMSQVTVLGTLRVAISELTANGSAVEIKSMSVTHDVPSVPYLVILGLGPTDHTVRVDSTLKLELQFSPESSVPVMLLWDDITVSTRLVLRVQTVPKVSLRIIDDHGKASTIFPENETGMVRVTADVSVEDVFRGTNIQMVSLSLTNSSGYPLIKDAPMYLTSRSEHPFRVGYILSTVIPSGRFNVTVSVRDVAKRTFVTAREITVTRFHTLILIVVDPHGRPLPSLNVSISASGQLIDEVRTDSTGTAASRAPSSRAVGPLMLCVRKSAIVVLSREIDVESDSVLQLEAPLYDWNFVVRLQSVNLPVSAARVDLYLNGTLLASATSDTNGVAPFNAIPLGTYEVAVTSSLASRRFLNMTHLADSRETTLELPMMPVIPESTFLILGGVAIVAVFGAFAAARRRPRTRRFKHVAELLGGAIPRSAVIMIVGPSGTGKTLLLQNVLADSLGLGRRCVYVSNSELPSKVKDRLGRMGLEVQRYEDENILRFVDAYSGGTGLVSSEKHSVPSPRDLTALGIHLTSCLEEVGGVGDVFFDSLAPIVGAGDSAQAFNFVEYYGARIVKSGGSFLYVASPTLESDLLSRFEEASDCVLQTEKRVGPGKVWGRLLVKKARGLEHQEGWVGFRITPSGRMEFVSLRAEEH